MTDYIIGQRLIDELIKTGIADKNTRRVTIDIPASGIPTIFIERVGTKTLLEIMPVITAGAQVVYSAQEDSDTRTFNAPPREDDIL